MKFFALAMFLAAAACSKANDVKDEPTTTGGKAPATGSAQPATTNTEPPWRWSGSGMAMAGSGSATGSGDMTAAGSGSTAMAGSGSGAGSGATGGSGAGSAAFDFDKLSHEEKMDFMKTKVVPTMKPLFQAFDAKKYAKFGCKTCHGKDPKATKFKMPNPELPKLDFAALKAGKQAPKVAEFMGKVVKPEMAKLLQEPEYTETNPKGFGCLECHQQKK